MISVALKQMKLWIFFFSIALMNYVLHLHKEKHLLHAVMLFLVPNPNHNKNGEIHKTSSVSNAVFGSANEHWADRRQLRQGGGQPPSGGTSGPIPGKLHQHQPRETLRLR